MDGRRRGARPRLNSEAAGGAPEVRPNGKRGDEGIQRERIVRQKARAVGPARRRHVDRRVVYLDTDLKRTLGNLTFARGRLFPRAALARLSAGSSVTIAMPRIFGEGSRRSNLRIRKRIPNKFDETVNRPGDFASLVHGRENISAKFRRDAGINFIFTEFINTE